MTCEFCEKEYDTGGGFILMQHNDRLQPEIFQLCQKCYSSMLGVVNHRKAKNDGTKKD